MLFACTVCLALGIAGGSVATRWVYARPSAPPVPVASECPACPPVPACPGESFVEEGETLGEPSWEARAPTAPGLPPRLVEAVRVDVSRVAERCILEAGKRGSSGAVVMELTVTASSGAARVEHVSVPVNEARDADLGTCLTEAGREAEVPTELEGLARLKVPLTVSPSSSELPALDGRE